MEDIGLTFWEKNEYESPIKNNYCFLALAEVVLLSLLCF